MNSFFREDYVDTKTKKVEVKKTEKKEVKKTATVTYVSDWAFLPIVN